MNPFKIGVVGGVNINKEYRVFDNSDKTIGFHIGGIYEYHFKNNTFLSGSTLFIKNGLTKTNDDLSDKNRNIMISVGYMF